MELLVIPSLLAIGLKIGIFLRYHSSLRRENLNLGLFFVAIFFLNIAELLSIRANYAENTMLMILLAYYCSVVFTIHSFINVCLDYAEFDWHTPKIRLLLNIALAGMIVSIILSRAVIAGVDPTSYSLTRIAGSAYWIFQVYALGGLIFAIGLLLRGLLKADSNIGRQRCMVVLLSSATPVLVTFGVIGMMAAGADINAAVFMSLALTLMLALMIYAEEKSRLFRLLTLVPFSRERQFHKNLLSQLTECITINDDPDNQQSSMQLKEMMKNFEGAVVQHVLGYYDGNQKKTASALGVSEATVSRRTRARTQ